MVLWRIPRRPRRKPRKIYDYFSDYQSMIYKERKLLRGGKRRGNRIAQSLLEQVVPLRDILHKAPHKLLQLDRALGIHGRRLVILFAIRKHELEIVDEVLWFQVSAVLEPFFHGSEVHRRRDDVVIVGDLVFVDGLQERPRLLMVLDLVEEASELVEVGAAAGFAGQGVHFRGPAGFLDGFDGEGVDGGEDAVLPLRGRLVDDVGFAEDADLGLYGFLLLADHAAGFQVADLGEQRAQHQRAALVVFDVAHPGGFG